MKRHTSIITVALLILMVYPAFRTFQWWEKYQKRKQLFRYFQKESLLTQKTPEDAIFYANLYDLRRMHANLQETHLSHVFAHWLDTGMSENHKVNRLKGGMLEKTILNVFGQEVIFAGLPSQEGLELLAIARLAPGSDFLLNLGLSSTNKIRKIEMANRTFYMLETKNFLIPEVFVFIENDIAYACTDLNRLAVTVNTEGVGPEFLKQLDVQPIPEDTVFFFRSAVPVLELEISGSKNVYRLTVHRNEVLTGPLPPLKTNEHEILAVQTNITSILRFPSVSYLLQSRDNQPISSLHLAFSNPRSVRLHREEIAKRLAAKESNTIRVVRKNGIHCYRWNLPMRERFLCSRGLSIVTAESPWEPDRTDFLSVPSAKEKYEITLKPEFHPDRLESFWMKVQRDDWSQFGNTRMLYFLSCLKEIRGAIDDTSNRIELEVR